MIDYRWNDLHIEISKTLEAYESILNFEESGEIECLKNDLITTIKEHFMGYGDD